MRAREEFGVAVRGGDLTVVRWPGDDPDAPVVLAVHGITSNALAWGPVADELAGAVTLVAPDLRGRAGSAGLPGPWGMVEHARDIQAVAGHLGLDQAVVAGHSMGAFAVAVLAASYPALVRELVLVDGGLGFPPPTGSGDGDTDTDIDAVLDAVLGPAMRRLGMTFADPPSYLDFWREHPAVGPLLADSVTGDRVAQHLVRDLVGDPSALRSSCVVEAVRADGADITVGRETLSALDRTVCPVTLLWAGRGLLDQPGGLYSAELLSAAGLDPARVRTRLVDGVSHYSILLGTAGAAAVADTIRQVTGTAP